MRTFNAIFGAFNASPEKQRRFAIQIEFDDPGVDDVWVVSHLDISLPNGTKLLAPIESISAVSQRIDPREGRASIGTLNFTALDAHGALTNALRRRLLDNSRGLLSRTVRLYAGDARMSNFSAQKELILTQLAEDIEYANGAYSVRCVDPQRLAQEQVFEPLETILQATVSPTATTIPVESTADLVAAAVDHGTSYSDAPSVDGVLYIRIGDEIIRTLAADATASEFRNCVRGVLGTRSAEHTADGASTNPDGGKKVEEVIYLEMPAVKLAYAVQTGALIGQVGTLPQHWHAGIPAAFIKLSDYLGIGTDIYDQSDDDHGVVLRFVSPRSTQAKRFVESQILRVVGLAQPVLADGQLGLRRLRSIIGGTGAVRRLTDSDIVKTDGLDLRLKNVVNDVDIQWNYRNGDPTRTLNLQHGASINAWGRQEKLTIQAEGLSGSRHSRKLLEDLITRTFDRHSGPPAEGSLTLLGRHIDLEVGDVVVVETQHLRLHTDERPKPSAYADSVVLNPHMDTADMTGYGDGAAWEPTRVLCAAEGIPDGPWGPYALVAAENHNTSPASANSQTNDDVINLVAMGYTPVLNDPYTLGFWAYNASDGDVEFGGHGGWGVLTVKRTRTNTWRWYTVRGTVPAAGVDGVWEVIEAATRTGKVYLQGILYLTRDQVLTSVGLAGSAPQLRHAFEIQSTRFSPARNEAQIQIFGSTQSAGTLPPLSDDEVIADSWFAAAGTDISSLPGVVDQGTFYEIASNLALTGNASLRAAGAIYYANKDLTVANGVTLTITQNVQLRVLGVFTNNGTIDGAALGLAGVSDTADTSGVPFYPTDPNPVDFAFQPGAPGGFGTTQAIGGIIERFRTEDVGPGLFGVVQSIAAPLTVGTFDVLPRFSLEWDGTDLLGLPDDLRGSSGGPGGLRLYSNTKNANVTEINRGGTGGAGGAGLAVIARGIAFGASGLVNTSGADGAIGDYDAGDTFPAHAGAGAGGAPGAILMIVDGKLNPAPTLIEQNVIATYGDSPLPVAFNALPADLIIGQKLFVGSNYPEDRLSRHRSATAGLDATLAAIRVQFVPAGPEPAEDFDEIDLAANQQISIGVVEAYSNRRDPAVTLLQATITQVATTDAYSHADIAYRILGTQGWTFVGSAEPTAIFELPANGLTYEIGAFAVLVNGTRAQTPDTATLVATDGSIPPSAPSALTATVGARSVGLQARVPATAGVPDIVHFWRATAPSTTFASAVRISGDGVPVALDKASSRYVADFSDSGVAPNQHHYFATAANEAGESGPYPSAGAGVTAAFVPGTPSALSAVAVGDFIRLDWTAPPATSDYDQIVVYRSTTNDFASAAEIARARSTSYLDRDVAVETTYYYWVSAALGDAESATVSSGGVKVESPRAVTTLNQAHTWSSTDGGSTYDPADTAVDLRASFKVDGVEVGGLTVRGTRSGENVSLADVSAAVSTSRVFVGSGTPNAEAIVTHTPSGTQVRLSWAVITLDLSEAGSGGSPGK